MEQQQRDVYGFGAGGAGHSTMRLSITSTTGSPVELTVPRGETVEGLRTRISQRLRLQRNRAVLLHKDRQLTAGRLQELGVADGSKLTLVPVIEAGLACSTARAETTVMDVLESLTESQISDFLSGQSPLTINLGIGAHVMYVQLQLSAQDVKELQTTGTVSHPGSASATSPAPQTPSPQSADSTAPTQFSIQRPRTSVIATAPTPQSSTTVPTVKCQHRSSLPQSCHSTHTSPYGPSLPSGCLQAATPVCSPAPTGSSPGPPSPVPASTFKTINDHVSSAAELCKQPGAVIESFESHSPGVFSGTFSGSLAPHSQTGISHRHRGVSIILQILSDLLRAACHHQGAPPTLSQLHCPVLNNPVTPLLTAEEPRTARAKPLVTQRAERCSTAPDQESPAPRSSTEEDRTLHCKLEHLQSLMHQRRLRRRSRRNLHLSQTSHPYQQRQHHP